MAPALICSGRPDSGVDYVNWRWLDEIGASPDALEAGMTNFIHPDDREEHLRRLHTSVDSGESSDSRLASARDGEYRWMLHHIQPLRDEHGTVVRWIDLSIDVEDLSART